MSKSLIWKHTNLKKMPRNLLILKLANLQYKKKDGCLEKENWLYYRIFQI